MIEVDKIYNEDCITGMQKIDSGTIDLIFTDPPFNYGKKYDTDFNDNKSEEELMNWNKNWLDECYRVLKQTGSIYIMYSMKGLKMLWDCMECYKWIFRNLLIWKQTSFPTKTNYVSAYQPILCKTKSDKFTFNDKAQTKPRGKMSMIPNKEKREKYGNECKLTNIWDDIPFVSAGCMKSKEAIIEEGTNKKAHPCQMPKELAKRAILFSTNEGDLVLDCFIGSGTTAHACKELNRNYIGFDISGKYVEMAKDRVGVAESKNNELMEWFF